MAWKVGDKVIYDFDEDSEILELETDGSVNRVRFAEAFTVGGRNLEREIVEQTPENLVISRFYKEMNSRLHKTCPHLNFPDVHWYLVVSWLNACQDGMDKFGEHMKKMLAFVEEVEKIYRETSVNGVRLFRR